MVKGEGGHADVFVKKGEGHAATTTAVATLLHTMPGVEHVYTNEQAQAFGIPASGSTSQAPDLWMTAMPGYVFEDGDDGDLVQEVPPRGQHGYPNSNPEMQALFIASGAHIRSGQILPLLKIFR